MKKVWAVLGSQASNRPESDSRLGNRVPSRRLSTGVAIKAAGTWSSSVAVSKSEGFSSPDPMASSLQGAVLSYSW